MQKRYNIQMFYAISGNVNAILTTLSSPTLAYSHTATFMWVRRT